MGLFLVLGCFLDGISIIVLTTSVILLITAFPDIVTWLPRNMTGG